MKCFVLLSLTILSISGVFTLNVTLRKPIDYRLLQKKLEISPRAIDCNKLGAGLHCDGCRNLVLCKVDPNNPNNLMSASAGSCPKNQRCKEGRCITASTAPDCSPIADFVFECFTIGVFPDPADCQKYHFCVPGTPTSPRLLHYEAKCEADANGRVYRYTPKTTYCDRVLSNKKCSNYPIPLCDKIGSKKALREHPTIYYTCAYHDGDPTRSTLYPYQYACPNGKRYNEGSDTCY